jgi:hypothetical protein
MSFVEDSPHGSVGLATAADMPHGFTRFQLPGFGLPLDFAPYEGYDTQKWNGKKREYEPVHVDSAGEGVKLLPNALNSNDLDGGSAKDVPQLSRDNPSIGIMFISDKFQLSPEDIA